MQLVGIQIYDIYFIWICSTKTRESCKLTDVKEWEPAQTKKHSVFLTGTAACKSCIIMQTDGANWVPEITFYFSDKIEQTWPSLTIILKTNATERHILQGNRLMAVFRVPIGAETSRLDNQNSSGTHPISNSPFNNICFLGGKAAEAWRWPVVSI